MRPCDAFDDKQAHAYLLRLVGVITATNFTPIGAVVDVAAFRSLSERKYFTGAAYRPRLRTHRRTFLFDEATFRDRLHSVPMLIRSLWS